MPTFTKINFTKNDFSEKMQEDNTRNEIKYVRGFKFKWDFIKKNLSHIVASQHETVKNRTTLLDWAFA